MINIRITPTGQLNIRDTCTDDEVFIPGNQIDQFLYSVKYELRVHKLENRILQSTIDKQKQKQE